LELDACKAVRARRRTLLEYINSIYAQWDQTFAMPITSVASGPAREIFVDAVLSQFLIERIAVISAIANQILFGFDHVEVEA